MQFKTIAATVAGLCLAVPPLATAHAGNDAHGCTKEPQSAWKAVDTSAAKAVALGYTVSKSKVSRTCHEIHATKDGRKFELYFNPVTNDLIHTASE